MEEQTMVKENKFKNPKFILLSLGMILLAAVIIISIIRDRIVNYSQNQVTVYGTGKINYAPDEAKVNLGMQIDKASTAQDAVKQLNDKMAKIIEAEKTLGIKEEDMKTQTYNVSPQYDWTDGKQRIVGYSATENLVITVKGVQDNKELVGNVITFANNAGANDVNGVSYDISNPNDLKQQARIAAINDAKNKAQDLFRAAGIRPGKIVGWYENNVGDAQPMNDSDLGMGGSTRELKASAPAQVPSGTQEIVIEMGVNYEVK